MAGKPTIEKQIELIKYLHEPHTQDEIEQHFKYSDRTTRNLFKDKIQFLNTKFPMFNRLVKGKHLSDSRLEDNQSSVIEGTDYKYRSTVHPIFLALNMTEVYMLTNHLLDLVAQNSYEDLPMYKQLVEKIYSQLSDPTRLRINNNGGNRYHLEKRNEVNFTSEDEMFHFFKNGILLYACKSGEKIRIILEDGTRLEGNINYSRGEYYLIPNREEKLKVSDLRGKICAIEKIT